MTETRLIRVYEYGCGPGEIENLHVAIEQMRRRIEFWNQLVEIDNDVRSKMEELLFAGKTETELSSLRVELNTLLRSAPLVVGPDEKAKDDQRDTAQISAVRAAIRLKLTEVRRIRRENIEAHRPELRKLDAERKARIAAVQTNAGLYWANRDEIRRNYESARQRAMRRGSQLQPQNWDETGKVSIQFQRGLQVGGAFLKNGRLQIDPVPEAAWNSPSRSERRRLARTWLRLRVAANDDRSPVWLNVPIILHRPLPEDGVIRSVSFIRERVGLTWRHRLLITVSEPSRYSARSNIAAGIDVGWRLTDRGLRVAYWVGQDDTSGELVLPMSDVLEFRRISTLDSAIRSAHTSIVAFLGNFLERRSIPVGLEDATRAALGSSSPAAVSYLLREWRRNRFSGDRKGFAKLCDWHKQHVHLWTWQANLRDQLIRRRRELYRRFAADLSSRYGQVFVNDIRVRRLAVKPPLPNINPIPVQRHHRFIVALSVLYRVLESACGKRGASFKLLKCQGATTSCNACGMLDSWDRSLELTHKCSRCGQSWDQDFNAAKNVLRLGLLEK